MSRTTRAAVMAGARAALAACTGTAPAGGDATESGGAIAVTAGDDSCEGAATEAPAGTITFAVRNTGNKVTEFYLYGTGDRSMGEVENIGPGLTREMIVEVPHGGGYTTACKPGMVGDGMRKPGMPVYGIRARFTVTGSATRSVDETTQLAEATAGYHRWVPSQIDALLP